MHANLRPGACKVQCLSPPLGASLALRDNASVIRSTLRPARPPSYFSRASPDAWKLLCCPVATIFLRNGVLRLCLRLHDLGEMESLLSSSSTTHSPSLSHAPFLPSLRTTHTFLSSTQSLLPRSVPKLFQFPPLSNSSHHALCSRRRRPPYPGRHRLGPVDQDPFPQHRSPAAGTLPPLPRSQLACNFPNPDASSSACRVPWSPSTPSSTSSTRVQVSTNGHWPICFRTLIAPVFVYQAAVKMRRSASRPTSSASCASVLASTLLRSTPSSPSAAPSRLALLYACLRLCRLVSFVLTSP